jgi:hypothetical protein
VDDHQSEQTGDAMPTEAKADWIKPEVDRLVAGGAQSGGATRTDGIDILS